jgi:hypothetical protein
MSTRAFVIAIAAALATVPAGATAADWSGPVRVPGHTGLTVPHVGMAASGEAVLMWSDGGGRIYAVVRTSTGRFSTPRRLAAGADGYAVRAEQLAVGRDGTAAVVWAQYSKRSPHYRVMAAVRRPHARFGKALMVGRAQSVFRSTPDVAIDRRGNVVVAWSRNDWPQLAVAPAGRAFGAVRTLRGWGAQIVIAFASDDRLYAAYSRGGVYAASARWPYRFAAPRRVAAGPVQDPALAAGPAGSMTLAWRGGLPDSEGNGIGEGAISAAVSQAGRAFAARSVVSPPGITGRQPVLAGGPRGTLVSWDKFDGGWPAEPAATAPVYTWLTQGSGTGSWLAPEPLAATGDWTTVPGMAIDANGIATVAYMRRATDTTHALVVRNGPVGTALGAEEILTTQIGSRDVHNYWWQAAVAASGRTTLVVWSRFGAGLVVFSRTT